MHGKRWLIILAVGSMLGSGALRAELGVGHDKAPSEVPTLEAEASAEVAQDLAVMLLFAECQAENAATAAVGVARAWTRRPDRPGRGRRCTRAWAGWGPGPSMTPKARAIPVPLEGGRTEAALSVRGSVQRER
jgi:hypothetical protein